MGKLIEADALLASLRESRDRANVWLSDCREYGSEMTGRAEQAVMTFNECILRVKGAPTVDAVPVVRCKDCRFSDWYTAVDGKRYCYCMEHDSSGHQEMDFCSYGEKDGDGNGV